MESLNFECSAEVGKFSTKLEKKHLIWTATIENRKVQRSWKVMRETTVLCIITYDS